MWLNYPRLPQNSVFGLTAAGVQASWQPPTIVGAGGLCAAVRIRSRSAVDTMNNVKTIERPHSETSGTTRTSTRADVTRLLGLSLTARVVLAEREMPVDSILSIRPGTIIEFDVPFDSELLLYAGNRVVGRGQAVKVGEKFGLRVTKINTVQSRIHSLGS